MSKKEAADLLADLHSDATNYLHTRSELTEVALIARIAYLLGEMKAPIKILTEADEAS